MFTTSLNREDDGTRVNFRNICCGLRWNFDDFWHPLNYVKIFLPYQLIYWKYVNVLQNTSLKFLNMCEKISVPQWVFNQEIFFLTLSAYQKRNFSKKCRKSNLKNWWHFRKNKIINSSSLKVILSYVLKLFFSVFKQNDWIALISWYLTPTWL